MMPNALKVCAGALALFSLTTCAAREDLSGAPLFAPQDQRDALELALSGLRGDDATALAAGATLRSLGEAALPGLRLLAKDADPRVQARAKELLGQITGQWGGGGLLWERSLEAAMHRDKPILVLHLYGRFDEEFC